MYMITYTDHSDKFNDTRMDGIHYARNSRPLWSYYGSKGLARLHQCDCGMWYNLILKLCDQLSG